MININEASSQLYHVDVLIGKLETAFKKYFPKSRVFADTVGRTFPYLFIRFFLAGDDKREFSNGIADNDPMLHLFQIDLSKKIDNSNYIIENKFSLEISRGGYFYIKARPNSYLVFERIKVPFRKTTGDMAKVVATFETYVAKLQKSVIEYADKIDVPFDIYTKLPSRAKQGKTLPSSRRKRV